MEIMIVNRVSKLWRILQRQVQIWCTEEDIPYIFWLGDTLTIPINSSKLCASRLKHTKKGDIRE